MAKTKAQKDATLARKSLVHWRKNLKTATGKYYNIEFYDISAHSCDLCREYDPHALIKCSGCPLNTKKNHCGNNNSPYDKVYKCIGVGTQPELISAIQGMIDALKKIVERGKHGN